MSEAPQSLAAESCHAPSPSTISERIAAFVHGVSLDKVPEHVVERAQYLILDAVGCAIAARHEPFAVRMSESVARLAGEGPHGVFGSPRRLPMRDAAIVNGLLAHGLDYDDTHTVGVIHLTVSLLPTVLATASRVGASGKALLEAYIAGIEAGARIASAAGGAFHRMGLHPTALVGTFASALAAGKLLGLDAGGLTRAQGIALSLAGGSLQFLDDGSWTKRLHPGWAANAGISAAHYAESGMPAPREAYEGRYGLYRMHLSPELLAECELGMVDRGLDASGVAAPWELMSIAVKPFPACHLVHGCADAAIALQQRGVDWRRAVRIRALVPAGAIPVVCEPASTKRRPTSDYDAKFSVPYAVASGLLRGHLDLSDLDPVAIDDPDARSIMDRVFHEEDATSTYPRHYTGEVVVELDDGTSVSERVTINRGHAERPLTNSEIEAKYFANSLRAATSDQAERVREAILSLASTPQASDLEALLTLQ